MKPFIILCEQTPLVCKSSDLEWWQFSDCEEDKSNILDFDSQEEAQKFIEDYDIEAACREYDEPLPKVVKRPEFVEAEKKQLSLF